MSALDEQIGGDHYKKMKIQPMEYSMANGLDACQHTIVKYVTRFRDKGGVQDLEKAKHVIDLLIDFESGVGFTHVQLADALAKIEGLGLPRGVETPSEAPSEAPDEDRMAEVRRIAERLGLPLDKPLENEKRGEFKTDFLQKMLGSLSNTAESEPTYGPGPKLVELLKSVLPNVDIEVTDMTGKKGKKGKKSPKPQEPLAGMELEWVKTCPCEKCATVRSKHNISEEHVLIPIKFDMMKHIMSMLSVSPGAIPIEVFTKLRATLEEGNLEPVDLSKFIKLMKKSK